MMAALQGPAASVRAVGGSGVLPRGAESGTDIEEAGR
jgi:hypothetical protein